MAGEGYRRQVGVGGPAGLPQADAGDFGAGVGAAWERAGGAAHESEIRAYRTERALTADRERTEVALRFQTRMAEVDRRVIEMRAQPAPGGVGHAAAVGKLYDQAMADVGHGVTEEAVNNDLLAQIAARRSQVFDSEYGWQTAYGTKSTFDNIKKWKVGATGRVSNAADPATAYKQETRDAIAMVRASSLSADQQDVVLQDVLPDLDMSYGDRIRRDDPAKLIAILDAGAFNGVLDADQQGHLRQRAEVDIRMRAAAARADAAQLKQEAREQLQTRKAELDTGAGKPSDWGELAASYEAIGDTSAAVEAHAKGVEMQTGLAYRGSTLPEMDGRLAALTAKQQGKGLTTAEASELKGLQSLRSQTETRLNQPGGALLQLQFATGKAPAPLDLNDPASFARRSQQSLAAQSRYGRATPEPLLPQDLQPLQDMMAGTAADKLQALDAIAKFPDPRVVRGAARQIAGDNGAFRIAATFIGGPAGHAMARDILNGPDALKANAGIWQEREARALFSEFQGPLLGMGPEYAADTFEAAKAIYASQMKATGASIWSKDAYRRSIEAAMGGVRAGASYKGGTATFNGARVMIPNGWTGDGVFRRIARMTGEDLGAARASGPGRWPDGSPIYTGQLRQMVPVYLGGTRYGFRSPQSSRLLPAEGGGPFTLDVAKVPWR